ncbi:MAG: ribonuclease III [Pseudomonadota bacterium]|nr:ribonuclease III [Pseudomonadota bacterium]
MPPRSERADDLPARLGHRFRDAALLRAALTHSSAGEVDNERLEFLGDAVLALLIGESLYDRFPEANEGQLSRLRASLVKRETLARLARGLMLGPQLILGEGEKRNGGAERDSNLANALEAVIGAIYLDGGIDACRTEVLPWFEGTMAGLTRDGLRKDPKTELQELLQSRRLPLPSYEVTEVAGQPPRQVFTVRCSTEALRAPVAGNGSGRRRAEQAAAQSALALLTAPGTAGKGSEG